MVTENRSYVALAFSYLLPAGPVGRLVVVRRFTSIEVSALLCLLTIGMFGAPLICVAIIGTSPNRFRVEKKRRIEDASKRKVQLMLSVRRGGV